MGQKVYEFIERLRNPEKRANSIGGGQNPMHQQWIAYFTNNVELTVKGRTVQFFFQFSLFFSMYYHM